MRIVLSIFFILLFSPFINAQNCPPNIDFEQGNFTGWQCYIGSTYVDASNQNVIDLSPSPPTADRHVIISAATTPALDEYGQFPKLCPYGGHYSVKLGNNSAGQGAEGLSYTFQVSPSADTFAITYYYAVVFENPGHSDYEEPRFFVSAYDVATGNVINCASYNYISTGAVPGFRPCNTDTTILYKSWTPASIDFTGLAGRTVRLEFKTADCTRGGHFGYAYVDVGTGCGGLINVVAKCDGSNLGILNSPYGFQSYTWYNADYSAVVGHTQNVTIVPAPADSAIFHVDLVPYPGYGCRDTADARVVVEPNPDTPIVSPYYRYCQFDQSTLLTAITSPGNEVLWYTSATGGVGSPPPFYPPTNVTGTFDYYASQRSQYGCEGPRVKTTVEIVPSPNVSFDVNQVKQCFTGNNFVFTNHSTNLSPGSHYLWSFGDGDTSNLSDPVHVYTSPGSYSVMLQVFNSNNCISSNYQTVRVIGKPVAQFNYSPSSICQQQSLVNLIDQSYVPSYNGSISNWWWNLGDTVLTSAYPAGFLVKDSSITVQLVVSTAEGCTSDTAKQVILVHGQPIANFQEAGVFCNGQVITYTDQSGSLPNETNSQWSWDFGDGASGSGVTVSHLYNSSGLMHVILTVTNSNGCKDTAQKVIPIEDLPLIKDSILNAGKLCSNEDVHLINLSTIPGYGSLHQLQIFWDYPSSSGGLVTTDTLPSINKAYTHLYPSFGVPDSLNKIIYIKSFNKSGCSTDFQHTITLRAVPKLHLDPLAPVCQEAPDYMLTGAYDIYHLGGALTLSGTGITNSPTFSPGIAGYGTWPIYYHDSSAFGCTTDTSQLIIVKPTPSIVTPAPQTTDPGYSITMPPSMVQGIGLSYEWIEIPDNNYPFAHYLNDNTLATPTAIRPEHDVNYWVKITTHPDGCVDSAMATLWVLNDIIIPNTITPNGDKVNDVWTIDGLSKFPHHHVEIFNRYGQLLFETNHYTPWDGTYKGKKLPFGTYYYIIELGEGRKAKTGYITIVY